MLKNLITFKSTHDFKEKKKATITKIFHKLGIEENSLKLVKDVCQKI